MEEGISNFSLLRNDFALQRQMVLFVGAGINYTPEVDLSWNVLIDYLFDIALRQVALDKEIPAKESALLRDVAKYQHDYQVVNLNLADWHNLHSSALNMFPPMVKASILKSVFGDRYISLIREFLYSRCNAKQIEAAFKDQYANAPDGKYEEKSSYFTLFQLARMISLCPFIKAVVSYNYDNFLTKAIEILQKDADLFFSKEERACFVKREVRDVFGDSYVQEFNEDGLFIYHVHGYIPPHSEIVSGSGNKIVLSMEEYYDTFRQVYSWPTATQLHFLSHYTCLFAGASLVDPAMQRMIHYAHRHGNNSNVYFLTANAEPRFSDSSSGLVYEKMNEIKNVFFTLYGLRPVYHPEGYYRLYNALGHMVSEVVLNRRKS